MTKKVQPNIDGVATAEEARRFLSVSRVTLYAMIKRGIVHPVWIPGSGTKKLLRIHWSELRKITGVHQEEGDMTTNREILDKGMPPLDMSIPPENLPTQEMSEYGVAFRGLFGVSGESPSMVGTALLRCPVYIGGILVVKSVANVMTSGAILAVEGVGSSGESKGAFLMRPNGEPKKGEVLVKYGADYVPVLTFAENDAVETCNVTQLQIPIQFVQMMQAQITQK